jgi:3-dehydroquinate dehydratase-2
MAKVLLLHGTNLNLLGEREPHIYGRTTEKEIEALVRRRVESAGHELRFFQSNHEGQLVDWLHAQRPAGFLIVNAGGLTHTSVALRDAINAVQVPFVEVHLSNLHRREAFRQHSYLSDAAIGVIMGLGPKGYEYAADYALSHLGSTKAGT